MDIKKVERTFVAFGKTEEEAFEDLIFDMNEATRDPDMDEYVYEDTTTEKEGLDEDDY